MPLLLYYSAKLTLAALVMVPAVSIMSSTSTATLPRTSPMRFITSDTCHGGWGRARGASCL